MPTKEKKVLILLNDTDPLLARVCQNKFQKEGGWESVITNDYDAAIESIKTQKPDLVITELVISDERGRTGFNLIEDVRSSDFGKGITIIAFSELSHENDKLKALEVGANKFFVKSEVTINEIIEEIKGIVS